MTAKNIELHHKLHNKFTLRSDYDYNKGSMNNTIGMINYIIHYRDYDWLVRY